MLRRQIRPRRPHLILSIPVTIGEYLIYAEFFTFDSRCNTLESEMTSPSTLDFACRSRQMDLESEMTSPSTLDFASRSRQMDRIIWNDFNCQTMGVENEVVAPHFVTYVHIKSGVLPIP